MGVQISDLIKGRELEMEELAGKKVAIDAFNTIFQFLSIIRDRFTGEPLKDSRGRVTSHLSGIIYRFTNMLEAGIKPVMVYDGEYPPFKKSTIKEREERKQEAEKKWKEAVEKGKPAIKYAQAASRLTDEMIESGKKLLGYMGIPFLQAPSEGEAMCAALCKDGTVDFAASQDYDSLLFGAPKLLRNISVSGKRKLPKQEVWIEVKPEVIELEKALKELGINREQLIIIGLLIGTDYNEGVKGVGPKTALKLVKEHEKLGKVLENVNWTDKVDAHEIFNWFTNPPTINKPKIVWEKPQPDKIIKFMVDEHDFSRERIEKVVTRIEEVFGKGAQASLGSWLKK